MRTHAKFLLVSGIAVLALGATISLASANRLSMTTSNIRAVWRAVRFIENSEVTVSCPLTLEGSFHSSTFSKVRGSLLGYITRAVFGERATCTGGSVRVLAETLPWHFTYEKFEGTLPNITHVGYLVVNGGVSIETSAFGTCLAAASSTAGIELLIRPFEPITIIWTIASLRGAGLCPFVTARAEALEGALTVLGTTTAVGVRLI